MRAGPTPGTELPWQPRAGRVASPVMPGQNGASAEADWLAAAALTRRAYPATELELCLRPINVLVRINIRLDPTRADIS